MSTCPKPAGREVGEEGIAVPREARSLKRSGWGKEAHKPGFHAGPRTTAFPGRALGVF